MEGGFLHQRQREVEEEGRITSSDGMLDSNEIKPKVKLQSQNTQNKYKKLKWPSLLPHSKNLLQEISLAFHSTRAQSNVFYKETNSEHL